MAVDSTAGKVMLHDGALRQLTRRRFLQLGSTGLSLGGLWRAQAAAAAPPSVTPIRACIFVFYYGGPSHLDTWDLKPDAPSTVRGEFQPISTSAPGVFISEHLPHMSRVMHKAAIVRSIHHTNRLHDSASIETHTGRQAAQGDREEFAPIPQFYPCHGSTVSYLRPELRLDVSHAALPWVFHNVVDVPCQGGGFIGSAYDPFRVTVDPEAQKYTVAELALSEGLSERRMAGRRGLLDQFDVRDESVQPLSQLRKFYEKAYQLIGSEAVRRALDVSEESPQVRERYGVESFQAQSGGNGAEQGYGRNMRGQNLLVARRLVEAGVPFVNVYDFRQQGQNWDSHADNFGQHKKYLLPPMDRALAALISDLDERGLLESTLVVATGEFGRTPQINGGAGRDHWPDCYSLVLAGGGVRGGSVYGASDRIGAYPARDPVTCGDLAATIFWRFGLNPATLIRDPLNRPHKIADGEPLAALFGA
jgi:hypothetical protein